MQGGDEEDYALRGEGELSAIHAKVDAWERGETSVVEWAAYTEEIPNHEDMRECRGR